MKKIVSMILTLVLLTGLTVSTYAVSLSTMLYGFTTDKHIYIRDKIPYKLLDEVLEVELGDLYICNENGMELDPDDIISTGCRLMKKHESNANPLYTYVVLGDINRDGQVTAADAREVLRASAKLTDQSDFLSMTASDVDASYTVTANDARKILRYAAKLDDYDTFSKSKLQNMGSVDQQYIMINPKSGRDVNINDLIDPDEISDIITLPDASGTATICIKLKNPSRDNADKLLYELNKSNDIYVNNPFDSGDLIVIG